MIYLRLFLSMFQIGLFSIGGGYAALPLIEEQVVRLNGWLTAAEFADVVTISEMTPGPIAINAATFVGIRAAGIPGALAATFGCVLPSCAIVFLLAKIYYKYRALPLLRDILAELRPAVVGLIASAGVSIALPVFFQGGALSARAADMRFEGIAVFAIGLFVLRRFKVSPTLILGGAGLAGLLLYARG